MGLAVVTVDGFLMPGYRMESEVMPIMTRLVFKLIAIAIAVASVTTIQPASAVTVSEQEAYDIGFEAYLYMYPLVIMDVTRRGATNVEAGKIPMRGPMNTFSHLPTFPPADFRDVVRPCLRLAPSGPGGPMCPMKRVNIKGGWS